MEMIGECTLVWQGRAANIFPIIVQVAVAEVRYGDDRRVYPSVAGRAANIFPIIVQVAVAEVRYGDDRRVYPSVAGESS